VLVVVVEQFLLIQVLGHLADPVVVVKVVLVVTVVVEQGQPIQGLLVVVDKILFLVLVALV
jgi:hypothetical protein